MSADRNAILALCADLDPGTVEKFLARVEPEYLAAFEAPAIAEHLRRLAKLSPQTAPELILAQRDDGLVDCTVLGFDRPFAFSLITGVLAGTGVSVESCDVFTLEPPRRAGRRRYAGTGRGDPMADAVIVDHFSGRLLGPSTNFDDWAAVFAPALSEVLALLESPEGQDEAQRRVNERVTRWLMDRRAADPAALDARDVLQGAEIGFQQEPARTRLLVRARDVPAFLYALSTALSLHALSIKKMRVRTLEGRAVDEIDFVGADGRGLPDASQLERLKLSVLLTEQFVYFLDRAPDPFTALGRFEQLAEQITAAPQRRQWLQLLANPNTMTDLARVLGASDYLWEEFIRRHAEALLPILRPYVQGRSFCPGVESLPRRLDEAMAGALGVEQQQNRLNEFKDRELFLIDLDHILSAEHPDARFRLLSERLVMLAETLVRKAMDVVYAQLVAQRGRRVDADGNPVRFGVFGLGKLGGVALGYASDIELLFVYDGISGGDFFEELAARTSQFIRTKRDGIFRVDLRLRPFGRDGPRACSRQEYAAYYAPGGPAHPFESLAMVRLRWIGGDAKLGFEIEQLRNRFLYEGPPLNLDDIWEIWGKMRLSHNPTRRLNSKHSPGALVDLESAVQLLQVKHAREAPQLATPRLHEAIEGLHRAGVLDALEFEAIMGAYQFFRRLINAQRMVRGSAQDLLVPAAGSDELLHLARRMDYARTDKGDDALLADFRDHTAAVRAFVQGHFGRAVPEAE